MKKALKAAFVLLLAAVFAFAADAAALELSVCSANVNAGKETEVCINVGSGSLLYTTEFFITYDSSQLEYVENSVSVGEAAKAASPYISAAVQGDGRLKIVYAATSPLEGGGEMCSVRFKAKRRASGTQQLGLEIEHAETFDGSDIKSIDFSSLGGSVTVTPAEHSVLLPVLVSALAAAAVVAAVIVIKYKKR